MFDPEKLLGGLITSGLGGTRASLSSGSVALGLLGVAMEAVSHYMDGSRKQPAGAPPPPPPRTMPPPSPTGGPPPMPPGAKSSVLPPPPPGVTAGTSNAIIDNSNEAVLLIRAMISAANADGMIDPEERFKILKRLESVSLSEEEKGFMEAELAAPKELARLLPWITSAATARKVYTVSLLAISVDTEAEKTYMTTLGHQLGLDSATISDIHQTLGIAPF